MSPNLAAYISVTSVFAITPGATTTVVVRNAIEGGFRTGLRTAIGAAGGNLCQALAAGLGLAVLVRQSPRAWLAVQIVGASYLAYLAVQSLVRMARGAPRLAATGRAESQDSGAAFRQGLIANVLNPSIGTFYLAILPSFLPVPAPPPQVVLFSAIHITIAFACHSFWAGAFDRLKALFVQPGFVRVVEGLTGAALLWLAWRLVERAF
jgi:threonine/homoserine/homoserine lactone efflux protein